MAGTGGAFGSAATKLMLCLFGDGDVERNVRSAIEPELFCRRKSRPPPVRAVSDALPIEELDPLRTIRLVWISPTGVGAAGCVLRAAAAAADEREALDWRSLRKACVAAKAAEGVGLIFWWKAYVLRLKLAETVPWQGIEGLGRTGLEAALRRENMLGAIIVSLYSCGGPGRGTKY
jgi:hypothetical protein